MALPLLAAPFAMAAARFVGGALFGTVGRTALTVGTADIALNDGRLATGALGGLFSAAANGASNMLNRSLGLSDPENPDAGLMENLMANPAQAGGLAVAGLLAYGILNNMLGSPLLAAIGTLIMTSMFSGQIGQMANSLAAQFTGPAHGLPADAPAVAQTEAAPEAPAPAQPTYVPSMAMGVP